MMHPPRNALSDDALQRLRAVQRETNLGAGFGLARSDLQMRGAGNLFGTAQKGDSGMADIGLDLYVEVLQKAMRYLEQKERLGLPDDPELEAKLLRLEEDERDQPLSSGGTQPLTAADVERALGSAAAAGGDGEGAGLELDEQLARRRALCR